MALFEAVRAACSPNVWSRGVELARQGAVIPERKAGAEWIYKVSPQGSMVPMTVHLWPADDEWACTCPSDADACAHVAAVAIALKRADEAGEDAPVSSRPVARVGYRFSRESDALMLERVLVTDGREEPVRTTLSALRGARAMATTVLITDPDLEAEDALGFRTGKARLPKEVLARLLRALAECQDMRLDGKVVRASPVPIQPLVLVEDGANGGFRVRLVRDGRIEEAFHNSVVRVGDVLHPVGDGGLEPEQRQTLVRGIDYGPEDVGRLISEVIPRLRARVSVDVRTRRLPTSAVKAPPRLVLDVAGEGETLHVLPTLVYGDPPVARVDRGRLTLLGGAVPLRDEPAERKLIDRLSNELGLALGMRAEATGEAAVRLAAKIQGQRELSVEGTALQRFRKVGALRPEVVFQGERLSVRFLGGEGEADPKRVLEAWRDGRGLVPLLGGGWAPLPSDWLDRHGHRLADLLAARDGAERLPRHALFDLARLAESLDLPPPPELAPLRALLKDFSGIPDAPLPTDLRASLRPYQRQGVNWLHFLRATGLGGILADDMGLGKTLQALTAVRGRTLVVAPTSVTTNWLAEARRFRPNLRVALYHGSGRALDEEADLTITSYALLRLDIEILSAVRWETVILDEAQAIKNPDSQVARAAYRLQAEFRLTLTGTPIENRLEELWSQLHFLNPGLLGGRSDFADRYARPIANGEAGVARRLRERIRPFVLRRMKKEVAPDLPPRTDMVLRCELDERERETYQAVRLATKKEIVAQLSAGAGVIAALEALLRLRQAACHPALVPGQKAERSSKVDLLVETLDEVASEGHKALVFSQWTGLLDLVEPALLEAGLDWVRLDGSTRDRAGVVAKFQDAGGPPVMLISLRAGGTGLNLTAADHVFLLDPWWNPAVEDQAADRAHRIGQENPVMVYRMVATDTVEERILDLQERKRALADAALGGADRAAVITRDELLALLA